jgi:hypothetical protein
MIQPADEELVQTIIDEVSDAFVEFTDRPWARRIVTEAQVGYGSTIQALGVRPIVAGPTEVRYCGMPVPSGLYRVSDAAAGFIYNRQRWVDTRPKDLWVTVEPAIGGGAPDLEFDYTGGYLMPGDDVVASGTASASGSAYNIVGDIWPLLVAGEFITVTGFAAPANNGRHRVVSRTDAQLVVAEALETESPTGVVSVLCRNLPRRLESLAVLEVKYRFMNRDVDPTLSQERLGDWEAKYGAGGQLGGSKSSNSGGLLDDVIAGLAPYVQNE